MTASAHEPAEPDYAERVRASFGRQAFMTLIGAEIATVEPGFVEIRLPFSERVTQQHLYFHGGVTGAIADSAAGYAAFSLFAADEAPLTSEYKINLLAPGDGEALVARARVLKPGAFLNVCRADVFAERQGGEVHVATALITIVRMKGRRDETVLGGQERAA
ncbi:PaaI family thioesterase [Oceanibacterium hippocampi]|uniref:Medium/long-chain acyl-CoA thioesterase YigI n=1 Tax=Oceanibacterium hippocampi TaxID=745714 RepID=A0A1Y5SLM0_9PROT|nr:PaaI family thioesterase [Oceanibacterium hippocampi]SLN40660.1 hypothetical protein OCH7691_01728 [Oceanibacterium hippocampi]